MNGQKALALKTMLESSSGARFGGRDDHDSGIEQRSEQRSKDHRIGDVVDLELVEAQQRSSGGEVARHLDDGCIRLWPASPARCDRAPRSMNALKWTRRLRVLGTERKNRSISIDLPRPTGRTGKAQPARAAAFSERPKRASQPRSPVSGRYAAAAIEALHLRSGQLLRRVGHAGTPLCRSPR